MVGTFFGLDGGAQVERLGAGQLLVADMAERAAAARVLDPGPGQGRVQVVGAVHEPGA